MISKKWLSIASAGVLALGLAACGDGEDNGNGGGDGEGLSGELTGTGASFPDAFYQAAIEAYAEVQPDVVVTYNAVGSGTGKSDFGEGLNDFAGTDSLVDDGDGPAEGSYLYVPTVAAPITVSYHLPEVENLQLSPDTLAMIFQRDITTWDDPAIAADNPEVELPGTEIVVAHRSDGSGTTSNFTAYLAEASNAWTLGSGDTVEWPGDTQGGDGNSGVAQIIDQAEGAIGYVDLADSNEVGLQQAAIQNADGNYVLPSLEGTTAGLDGAQVNADLTYNPLNAAGPDAYGITAPTYILIRTDYDEETAELVKDFITFLLTDGQDLASSVDFAALPDSLREQALAQLDQI